PPTAVFSFLRRRIPTRSGCPSREWDALSGWDSPPSVSAPPRETVDLPSCGARDRVRSVSSERVCSRASRSAGPTLPPSTHDLDRSLLLQLLFREGNSSLCGRSFKWVSNTVSLAFKDQEVLVRQDVKTSYFAKAGGFEFTHDGFLGKAHGFGRTERR